MSTEANQRDKRMLIGHWLFVLIAMEIISIGHLDVTDVVAPGLHTI